MPGGAPGRRGALPSYPSSYEFVLGLGVAKASKVLRFRHRLVCAPMASFPTTVASLVSEGGKVVPLTIECATASKDQLVTLPSEERWALAIQATAQPSLPCNYPIVMSPPTYELDEFAFE